MDISSFQLSEEQQAVAVAARDFARSELLAGVIERDEAQKFPKDAVHKMGKLGFMGICTSPEYGGAGMDNVSYALAIEELSKVDASAGVIMSVNNSLVCAELEKHGSEEQKKKYLTPLASGEMLGCFALSEPEAGSDATAVRTLATDCGDHYLLNGTKNWITNGGSSDVAIVIAQTNPLLGHKGMVALIVEKSFAGFALGPKENKMGIRASDTHSLLFTDVKVPKENRIGPEGFGFKYAMYTLNGGRIGIAAQALGIAGGAFERSVQYAKERKAFGKTLAEHQDIQFKLAKMQLDIEASRLLIYKAAALKDVGADYSTASALAKLHASETAMWVTTEAVQIHGGYGYVKEFHVERMMRDAKITQIYEGTSEVQKMIIARDVLK